MRPVLLHSLWRGKLRPEQAYRNWALKVRESIHYEIISFCHRKKKAIKY